MLLRALFLSLCCCGLALAGGVTGRGGLETVAVSPDGKLVAAGGQNRVVYLLDAATLEVKRRIWAGARVGGLAFTKDGKRLAIEDETDLLTLLDLDSGKTLAKLTGAGGIILSPAGDHLAFRDAGETAKNRLRLVSLDKLEEAGVVELPDRPVAWTFDAAGKRLFILGAGRKADEKRLTAAEVPRELKGLARWTFRLKNDGVEAYLYQAEVPAGKVVSVARTWYTSDSDSTRLVRLGDRTLVFNRANLCARIDDRGDTAMFETTQPVNHAVAASPDGKVLVLGGQGEGSLGPVEGARAQFRVDPPPGQAEYFNRFFVAADGSAWGVTTAFRIVRVNKFGRVEQVAPVY